MKRRAGYGDEWEGPLPFGTLHDVQDSSDTDEEERPVATLFLPNPDTRRGWELHTIWRDKPKTQKRGVGFGR